MVRLSRQTRAERLGVRLWSADEFAASSQDWEDLRRRSDADPLFMSWDWQWRWWRHHGASLGAELQLVGVYRGANLVGLAPLYAHQAAVRGLLHPRRLELIGTAWRNPRAAFSDYLDILVDRAHRVQVLDALAGWLRTASWDDAVLCCLRRGGAADALVSKYLRSMARVREADALTGWRAPLPREFETFVRRLSPDVRRRVFNHRRKLDNARLQYARETEVAGFLGKLWEYSTMRWGATTLSPECQSFYREFATRAAQTGQLRLSQLETDRGPLSVMLNVQVSKSVYYLQSGFDLNRSTGISPGYLHFGYAIEAACAENVQYFDFLAGLGRSRDYKRDLLTEIVPLVTYHAARGVLARSLYATYGVWRRAKDLSGLE